MIDTPYRINVMNFPPVNRIPGVRPRDFEESGIIKIMRKIVFLVKTGMIKTTRKILFLIFKTFVSLPWACRSIFRLLVTLWCKYKGIQIIDHDVECRVSNLVELVDREIQDPEEFLIEVYQPPLTDLEKVGRSEDELAYHDAQARTYESLSPEKKKLKRIRPGYTRSHIIKWIVAECKMKWSAVNLAYSPVNTVMVRNYIVSLISGLSVRHSDCTHVVDKAMMLVFIKSKDEIEMQQMLHTIKATQRQSSFDAQYHNSSYWYWGASRGVGLSDK